MQSQTSGSLRRALDWSYVTNEVYVGGSDLFFETVSSGANFNKRYATVSLYTMSVARDGTYAAFGGQGGLVYIWNVMTKGSEIFDQSFNESSGTILTATAISPDS